MILPPSASMSHVTRHTSQITRHTSRVIRHMSHITHHTSHITRHTSPKHHPRRHLLPQPLLNQQIQLLRYSRLDQAHRNLSNVTLFNCPNTQACKCYNFQLSKHTSLQMLHFSSVQTRNHTLLFMVAVVKESRQI